LRDEAAQARLGQSGAGAAVVDTREARLL